MPDQKISNYISLSRKFFNHEFWQEERLYSKAEAWIDLIQLVAYNEHNSQTINGRLIKWGRGQYPASLRFLSNRWKWPKDKVSRFLAKICDSEMINIETQSETHQTIITLCNYDSYNIDSKKTRQQMRQQRDSNKDNDRDSERDKYKQVRKTEEEAGKKERSPPALNFENCLIYDIEQELLKNQKVFDGICMKTNRDLQTAKFALKKFHLAMIQKDSYPQSRKQLFAGFEVWLMNEKKISNGSDSNYDGIPKNLKTLN